MAIKRLVINGYGQLEINNCAFRRDGRIEAQLKPHATDFASIPVENGMLLEVDNVAHEVKLPTAATAPLALVYTPEHVYEAEKIGLKEFAIKPGMDMLPRLGYLSVGDKFTTNCICYADTEFATESNLKTALAAYATTAVYGGYDSTGAIKVSNNAPASGPKFKVIGYTNMPDGQIAVKFWVLA